MDTCCFKEATHAIVEVAELQLKETEFKGRVLDHFVSIYDTPDWHQFCLPWKAHSLPSQEWHERLLFSPPWNAMSYSGDSPHTPQEWEYQGRNP